MANCGFLCSGDRLFWQEGVLVNIPWCRIAYLIDCRQSFSPEERVSRGGAAPPPPPPVGLRRGAAPPARHQFEDDTADFPASPPQGAPPPAPKDREGAYHREDRDSNRWAKTSHSCHLCAIKVYIYTGIYVGQLQWYINACQLWWGLWLVISGYLYLTYTIFHTDKQQPAIKSYVSIAEIEVDRLLWKSPHEILQVFVWLECLCHVDKQLQVLGLMPAYSMHWQKYNCLSWTDAF